MLSECFLWVMATFYRTKWFHLCTILKALHHINQQLLTLSSVARRRKTVPTCWISPELLMHILSEIGVIFHENSSAVLNNRIWSTIMTQYHIYIYIYDRFDIYNRSGFRYTKLSANFSAAICKAACEWHQWRVYRSNKHFIPIRHRTVISITISDISWKYHMAYCIHILWYGPPLQSCNTDIMLRRVGR